MEQLTHLTGKKLESLMNKKSSSQKNTEKINKNYAENSNKVCDDDEEEITTKKDDEYDDENGDKHEKAGKRKKLEKKLIEGFKLRFEMISMDDKWRLFSGIFAEDDLYNWAVTQRSETLAHSFILDTGCQKGIELFSLEEKEIITNTDKKTFSDVVDDVKKYVMKYHKPWLVSHVWIFVIEVILKDIEEIRIGKSDGGSSASKIRKNKKRKIGESVIRGRKIDLLLKLCNSSREILAGKVARTGDIRDKKTLKNRMKLLKLMKDMPDLIIESLPSTTIENYRKNKGIIYIMDRSGGVVSRLTKKANLEAPIYIEGLCGLILSIITILELKVQQMNQVKAERFLAIGPLTNIALAHSENKSVFFRVKQTITLGDNIGNVTLSVEFNFFSDLHAVSDLVEATKGYVPK
ncbi:10513_t:CDS:2 [Entrophospora sp. SA101]|nr:14034_t:CDS:2 [Entrophospora sp. SA101]CAJ0845414.1 10513_t:CDS:2 [Entrophospora sp. SA101]